MEGRKIVQAYQQTPWRFQLQIIGLFLLILVMVALIAGIYLNVTARAATIGRQIQFMQAEIRLTQRLNADLETRLALLTSARGMEVRAEALGFRRMNPDEITYLRVPGYSGRKPASLAPPPGPVQGSTRSLPPEFTESLIDWLSQMTERMPTLLDRVMR